MQFQFQETQKSNCQVVQTPKQFDTQLLKQISNHALLSEVKNLARDERRITHEVLLRIQEVERRKLHLDLGFPSILDWLVKDIGYSESAAYRRMQAARLLDAIPDAGEKLKSGEVSLSTLAKVQSVVKQEEKRTQSKIENTFKAKLIEQLESKSIREAEKILVQTFPEIASSNESLRFINSDESRLSVTLDNDERKDLERAKELFSNIKHDMKWSEVIAQALKIALDQKDPLRKKVVSYEQVLTVQQAKQVKPPQSSRQRKSSQQMNQIQSQLLNQNQNQNQNEQNEIKFDSHLDSKPVASQNLSELRHAITHGNTSAGVQRKPQPAQVRRHILQRDGGSCTYRDPKTARVCGSRHQIEIDHIIPVALGGTNDIANLRCLCRRHNLARAERTFGYVGKSLKVSWERRNLNVK